MAASPWPPMLIFSLGDKPTSLRAEQSASVLRGAHDAVETLKEWEQLAPIVAGQGTLLSTLMASAAVAAAEEEEDALELAKLRLASYDHLGARQALTELARQQQSLGHKLGQKKLALERCRGVLGMPGREISSRQLKWSPR